MVYFILVKDRNIKKNNENTDFFTYKHIRFLKNLKPNFMNFVVLITI